MINIILDIGTLNTKAGFGGEVAPRITTESYHISA
jgi:actin-related protein